MKLRLWRVVLIPIFGILVSCTNEVDSLVHEEDFSVEDVESTSPHHIPISKALSSLESIMESMGMDNTRAMNRSNWTVTRVPMSTFKPQTRTGSAEVADALYVVDFEEGGYAILSADDRLPDEVIAVTNSGDLEFNPNPLEDPVLTLDDLYVEEDDDYLLGSEPRNDGTSAGFIEGLVANYVIGWTDSLRDDEDEFGDPMLPPGGGNIGGGDSGGGTEDLVFEYSYRSDMLSDEKLRTVWHQESPYNDQCDKRYHYKGLLGIKYSFVENYDYDTSRKDDELIYVEDLYAGCVAIATAQILAYNKYPILGDIIGVDDAKDWEWLFVDYNTIADIEKRNEFLDEQEDCFARLCHYVGEGCDMNYGFMGTDYSFATPNAAKKYLQKLGYTNVVRHIGYDDSIVKAQIEKDCPVLLGAMPRHGVNGHAWVIDGYKITDKICTIKLPNGTFVSEIVVDSTNYVHCNWGWGGSCDGWFSSTLLDTDDYIDVADAESYDDSSSSFESSAYTWLFRMVTYDKPIVQ